jgi:hypothetical protein
MNVFLVVYILLVGGFGYELGKEQYICEATANKLAREPDCEKRNELNGIMYKYCPDWGADDVDYGNDVDRQDECKKVRR